jgi:hypothetical protein
LTFCHVNAARTDAAVARSSGTVRRYFMIGNKELDAVQSLIDSKSGGLAAHINNFTVW